jgi:hypothetical protein
MDVNEVSVEEMEKLICQLPAVLRCAVSVNDWGGVEEIHVLTSLDRTPKQVVRDVESALLAGFGLKVDHKCISVAQIVPPEAPAVESSDSPKRLYIYEYHMDQDTVEHTARARVTLSWGTANTDRVTGEWTGRYLPSQSHYVMGAATVDALNQLPGMNMPIVLAECRSLTIARRTIVVVALSQYDARRRESVLIGTAEDRGDGQGASVRAVLDAVNRKLARFLP